jgi:hypothetical protein
MKDIKKYIIKVVAVIVSFMYLLTPIHSEVIDALHSLSHGFLSKPTFVLSHGSQINLEQRLDNVSMLSHDHKIIDFIDNIFTNKKQSKGSEIPIFNNIKIDKHVCSSKYKLFENISFQDSNNSYAYLEQMEDFYYKKQIRPPQLI